MAVLVCTCAYSAKGEQADDVLPGHVFTQLFMHRCVLWYNYVAKQVLGAFGILAC